MNKCMMCKHFVFKILVNGFHGMCDIDWTYKRLSDNCDAWEEREL